MPIEKDVYTCYCSETLRRSVDIEEQSSLKALKKLEQLYDDGKIILDYSDLVDVEFSDCEYSKKEISILSEISDYCKVNCGNIYNCSEENCVLFRIEQIIVGGKHRCCICGEIYEGEGNNPYPVVKDDEARCCDRCNVNYVIPARLSEDEK